MKKDKEEDVNSYWMTLRKREDAESSQRKQQITISGELALKPTILTLRLPN
jgi:hypothetical protein